MPLEPHKPNKPNRRRVQLYVALGLSETEIAVVLKIGRDTLRKYYAEELANGRAVVRAEIGERLRAAADKGNVTAMKHLDMRTSEDGQAGLVVGKKEQQAKAAASAGIGTEWGNDLQPVIPPRTN